MQYEDPFAGLISMLKGGARYADGAQYSDSAGRCNILGGVVTGTNPLTVRAAGLELDEDEIIMLGGGAGGMSVHVEGDTAVFEDSGESSAELAAGDALVLLTADMQTFYAFRKTK